MAVINKINTRGSFSTTPLGLGELAYDRIGDKSVYIGDGSKNVKFINEDKVNKNISEAIKDINFEDGIHYVDVTDDGLTFKPNDNTDGSVTFTKSGGVRLSVVTANAIDNSQVYLNSDEHIVYKDKDGVDRKLSNNEKYVDTIEDMFNIDLPKTNDVCVVRANGVGGTFIYDNNIDKTIDDGGVVRKGWVRKTDNVNILAEWFGVLSNKTDVTENFQKAINALGFAKRNWNPQSVYQFGNELIVSKGDILITDTLYVPGGITIRGINKTSTKITFKPDSEKDLFVKDDNKFTRDGLNLDSFMVENISFVGDAVMGDKANRCFDFRYFLNSSLNNVDIFNFNIGIEYGLAGYYCTNTNVSFRANFKNIVLKEQTGPVTFTGGSMTAVASELSVSSKILECYVEIHEEAKIVFIGTSLETPTTLPVVNDFAMIRGDYNGNGNVGQYSLSSTYHEGYYYIGEYSINSNHGGVIKFNPLSNNSPMIKFIDYWSNEKDNSKFPTSKTNLIISDYFNNGNDSYLLKDNCLLNGPSGLSGNHNFVLGDEEFFTNVKVLKKEYTNASDNTFPYYYDIPIEKIIKFAGRTLFFSVIDKIENGVMDGLQIYIDGVNYKLKATTFNLVDYGNGYFRRVISTYIPKNSLEDTDITKLRIGVKIDAGAGCIYRLAYASVFVDGNDSIIPVPVSNLSPLDLLPDTPGDVGTWWLNDGVLTKVTG